MRFEAGATDYCSVPIETRQFLWLMESAMPRPWPHETEAAIKRCAASFAGEG